ncbi:site-2 protease family protein [Candidatus Kaiserbacteria bacterium]|nr:site-2 protease family protein [Candidatus Kaiserbacteria bacterium]
MAILVFLLILFVLVLVHEWGHFIVAKKSGIRVDEFGIGFPPKLFGVRKGETEYTLNLLPIGGFVRIYGENAEDAVMDAKEGKDISRSFVAKGKWQQAAVLVAGVTMNILFAWLLFAVALGVGMKTVVEESAATDSAVMIVTDVLHQSPAEAAGLTPGAEIIAVSVGEAALTTVTPTAFSAFIGAHGNEEVMLTYRAGGETHTTTVIPTQGIITDAPTQTAIGTRLVLTEVVSQSFMNAIIESAVLTATSLRDIIVGLGSLLADALHHEADFSQIAGPVGIVGLVGEASAFGLASLLMFTAFISLNLAVINLLPFPALDGGRLLFVAIEAIKGSPINPVWAARLNIIGFFILILLMVAVTYNDIIRML